jgi:uncharacterized protein
VGSPVFGIAEPRHKCDGARPHGVGNGRCVIAMSSGSIAGTIVGGLLLGVVPSVVLVPLLVLLLLLSAVKVWRHD